jgi:hypothetical protein
LSVRVEGASEGPVDPAALGAALGDDAAGDWLAGLAAHAEMRTTIPSRTKTRRHIAVTS